MTNKEQAIQAMKNIVGHDCIKECRPNEHACMVCGLERLYDAGYRLQPTIDVEKLTMGLPDGVTFDEWYAWFTETMHRKTDAGEKNSIEFLLKAQLNRLRK